MMKKIALLYCAGALNIGNSFINTGGQNLCELAFPDFELVRMEILDSALGNWQHPSPALLPHQIEFINNECVAAIMFAGSILTPSCQPLLDVINGLNIPTALLGASCYRYDQADRKIVNWAVDAFDIVITRDDPTASFENVIDGNRKITKGIDLAFWFKTEIAPIQHSGYAVVNIDQNTSYRAMSDKRTVLLNGGFKEVYIVENTEATPKHVPGYIQISYPFALWDLYAHAGYVETCRIHTSLCCLVSGTYFRYVGHDEGGIIGRNTLFNKVEVLLSQNSHHVEPELAFYEFLKNTRDDTACDIIVSLRKILLR